MPLVFAFGSNMDPQQMKRRCASARFRGVHEIHDHRLAFVGRSRGWGGAVATIEPRQGAKVVGVLWQISKADLEALDGFEGAPHVYRRVACQIRGEAGPRQIWIYVHNRPVRGRPSASYVATIRRGFKFARRSPKRLENAVKRCGGTVEAHRAEIAESREARLRARLASSERVFAFDEHEVDAALDELDRRAQLGFDWHRAA